MELQPETFERALGQDRIWTERQFGVVIKGAGLETKEAASSSPALGTKASSVSLGQLTLSQPNPPLFWGK